MKNNQLAVVSVQLPPALEAFILKRDNEIQAQAERDARLLASKRISLPKLIGDTLAPYVERYKTEYEKLNAEVMARLQPGSHFAKIKIDADAGKEHDRHLDKKIADLDHENNLDQYALGTVNTAATSKRIAAAILCSLIFLPGEILYNTNAFQVAGENLLFALIVACTVSVAVAVASHVIPLMYKATDTKLKRRLIAWGSLGFATALFCALAVLRSAYFAANNVSISPVFFVIINLFLLIVSTVLSYLILPSWEEIKEYWHLKRIVTIMQQRKKKKEELEREKHGRIADFKDTTKFRIDSKQLAGDTAERISRMYYATVALFKGANIAHRQDGAPDCFQQETPVPDIAAILFTNSSNQKVQ